MKRSKIEGEHDQDQHHHHLDLLEGFCCYLVQPAGKLIQTALTHHFLLFSLFCCHFNTLLTSVHISSWNVFVSSLLFPRTAPAGASAPDIGSSPPHCISYHLSFAFKTLPRENPPKLHCPRNQLTSVSLHVSAIPSNCICHHCFLILWSMKSLENSSAVLQILQQPPSLALYI